MKKILMSLFISVATISVLWASNNITIKDINWNEKPIVPFPTYHL